MRTNINITGSEHTFNYIILYKELGEVLEVTNSNVIRNRNVWTPSNSIFPTVNNGRVASVSVLFPSYCLDVYEERVKYALSVNTWINGKEVNLLNRVFDKNELLALDKVVKINGLEYYQSIDFIIPNAYDIMYSDEYSEYRRSLGEVSNNNSNGSVLFFTLHPLEEGENNTYIKHQKYDGGGNSINFSISQNEYMSLKLELDKTTSGIFFKDTLIFNSVYERNYNGLKEYLKETYNIEDKGVEIYYNIVVKDNDNIYKTLSKRTTDITQQFQFVFSGWNDWVEGSEVTSMVIIEVDGDPLMTLMSNPIPLTPDLFRFLISQSYINIDNIHMNEYNIHITNEIKKEVVQLEMPDNKANVIDTIFFRVSNTANIVIHPEVTEYICINLDAYKSKVSSFVLQVEGIKFKEESRNPSGSLFKVIGSTLPGEKEEGSYYVLSQDGIMITSGKYKYE